MKKLITIGLFFSLLYGCATHLKVQKAVLKNDFDLMKSAVEGKQQPESNKSLYEQPMDLAADERLPEFVTLLRNQGYEVRANAVAAAVIDFSALKMIDEIFDFRSPPSTKSSRNAMPTLRALLENNPRASEILSDGTNITIGYSDRKYPKTSRIRWSYSPLSYAMRWGNKEEIEYLIQKGAEVASYDIHIAAYYNNLGAIESLLGIGVPVDSPLTIGFCDSSNVIYKTVDMGLSVGGAYTNTLVCFNAGETPILMAAANGSLDAAKLLAKNGANLNASTSIGGIDSYAALNQEVNGNKNSALYDRSGAGNSSSVNWGKILTAVAGNAYAADKLNAEQFSRFSKAFTQDVMQGTTSNTTALTNQLRQENQSRQQQLQTQNQPSFDRTSNPGQSSSGANSAMNYPSSSYAPSQSTSQSSLKLPREPNLVVEWGLKNEKLGDQALKQITVAEDAYRQYAAFLIQAEALGNLNYLKQAMEAYRIHQKAASQAKIYNEKLSTESGTPFGNNENQRSGSATLNQKEIKQDRCPEGQIWDGCIQECLSCDGESACSMSVC